MSPEGSGCCECRVLQVPLPNSEPGTQPVEIGMVLLKSALARIWLEKVASPFLLGMENIFPEQFQCMDLWLRTEILLVFSRLAEYIGLWMTA